jgi:hypothetical protein
MTTLRKLGADGTLRPARVGRAQRYRRSDVEAFVESLAATSV